MHSVCKSFEVGKLYKKKGHIGLYKCLSIHLFRKDEQCGVMQYVRPDGVVSSDPEDKGDIPSVFKWDDTWYEHKEPVVIKERRLVLIDGNDVYLPTQKSSYGTVIGEIEVVITDSKLIDVRVV